jgi:hypothetical protein
MRQIVLLIFLALFLAVAPPGYTTDTNSEYQVKAAYLYNFAKFIQWPESAFASAKAPLVIGVFGKDPFKGELAPLTARKVRDRSIEVRTYTDAGKIDQCHLLYIAPAQAKQFAQLAQTLSSKPIVTVGDRTNFARAGGIIQFVTKRDRLRFIVNLDQARKINIKISAQLLALAVEVLEATE